MVQIDNDCFSIPQICESGQCFRLDPVPDEPGAYELIARDRYVKIQTKAEAAGEGKTVLACSGEEFETFWKHYFDLDTCYRDYLARVDEKDGYLNAAAAFGSGIRILRQDPWEMIITFILSQQNNISRIKGLIRSLCEQYGTEKTTEKGTVYYAFPEPEALAEATEEELRGMKLGYRSPYICKTARMAAEGKVDLDRLYRAGAEEARRELMKFPGIGKKVADCICLFALHKMDSFPVDTHIKKVLDTHYSGGFPFDRYKGCAGVMQQYIFYYDLKGTSSEQDSGRK